MRVAIACTSTLLGLLLSAPECSAGQVIFLDETFDDADWTAEKIDDTSPDQNGIFDAEQVATGGDPGAYRRVTLSFPEGNLVVAHFHDDWVYAPTVLGNIESIDHSYSLRRESSPQSIRYRLVLEQDGVYYSSVAGDVVSSTDWVAFATTTQTAGDFTSDPLARGASSGLVPNFSSSGSPIRLGYRSSNCCNNSTTSGIDNFVIRLHTLPLICQVVPAVLDFGEVMVGSSAQLPFVFTNIGQDPLQGDISEDCDNYSIVSGEGPFSLEAGDSLTVVVEYAPVTDGTHGCTVKTGCASVTCEGTAPPFVDLRASSVSCALAVADSVLVSAEFENAGTADAGPFEVRVDVTGCNPLWSDTQLINGLPAGGTDVIQLGPIPVFSLPCSASLLVDLEAQISESDESNNEIIEEPVCLFPELDPVEISCRQYAPLSDSVLVSGVFGNSGSGETGAFAVRMQIQGCVGFFGDTQVFQSLSPGQRDTIVVGPFSSTAELCMASLNLDVNDDVEEIDETDNVLVSEVTCTVVDVGMSGTIRGLAPQLVLRPNPATGSVIIEAVGSWGPATLTVFDLAGRRVKRMRLGPDRGPMVWDANNDTGTRVAPGVYFVRLQSATMTRTGRLLLLD